MGTMDASLLARNVLWNGWLALIPVWLAYVIVWVSEARRRSPVKFGLIGILSLVWLAFLPNTCYLLTEWRHFLEIVDGYDLFVKSRADSLLLVKLCALSMFYLLYSGFGMLTFTMAVRPLRRLAQDKGAATRFWAPPFFVALSLGVYLGLVLRFNSWDLATHLSIVWRAIVEVGGRPRLIAFILAFGGFLWVSYEVLDIWFDGVALRWNTIRQKRQPEPTGTGEGA